MKLKFSLTLVSISILMLFSNCTDDGKNNNIIDSIKVDIIDTVNLTNDNNQPEELIISDTQVLFFVPSSEKKRELMNFYGSYNQYTFNIIYNDFSILYKNVKDALRSRGINVELTHSEKFIFIIENDTLIYDLDIENQFIGYILSDGINFPIIRNGVQHPKDVSNDIRNYYNIANFNIYSTNIDTSTNTVETDSINPN